MPAASITTAKIRVMSFDESLPSSHAPVIPPATTPIPDGIPAEKSKLPLKKYTIALTTEIGRIIAIAVA